MKEPSVSYWDRTAKRYAKTPVADEAAYQKKLSVTRTYLRPQMKVLEIGCGTGATAIAHAPYVKHVLAVDFSASMIEIARRNALAQGTDNISFEPTSVNDLQLPDESIDVALALSVLHLLENKDDAIAKIFRLLRKDGVFVTSTMCLGDTMKFIGLVLPVARILGLLPLVKVFTKQALRESLTRAGFLIDYEWQPAKGKAVFIVAKKSV